MLFNQFIQNHFC